MRRALRCAVCIALACGAWGCSGEKATEGRPHRGFGLVTGKTMHVTHGIPGGFHARSEGESVGGDIPPYPIPGVEVHFRSQRGTYMVTSGSDGAFAIELPPGKYEIGWLDASDKQRHADPFAKGFEHPLDTRQIVVEAGKTYERVLVVREVYID